MNKFTNYVQTERHWLARATALPTSVSKHTELDTLHARLRNITATSTETTHATKHAQGKLILTETKHTCAHMRDI